MGNKSHWLGMPFPGSHSQVFYWGATRVAYLLRSRFILQHLHFPKFQANTPAFASFYSIPMAAAASSSKPKRNYDVFLSFRGTVVRNNFLGHLYMALDQHGFFTYIDSKELRKGEQISPALMNAIEESRVAIIIFSKDYASSPWCLEEVAKIMECKEQRDLMVFPVFYKVDPCEVRTPRENYREAMAKHEIKFGKDSEKVNRWKKALFDAGSLSGWHFTDGYEAGLIQHIVQEISTQLDRTPLHVAKYPVGIDSRVQELQTILNLQSKDDILMVGLWGQGGVGKTTLAKAIYNTVFREFQGSSFLERVRENSNDLVPLQEKLLSEVLLGKKLTVYNVGRGSRLIQDRLCNKKVLIILDDVDDECQLDALVGDCKWFGKGSRIIITTRNKHLLSSHGVDSDRLYKVETLKDSEALELFRKHAFLRSQKIEIRRNLVDSVLHYCRGLPLALQVLGSFLCGRGEKEWKSILQKLAKSPNKNINDVLKVSYDGLDDHEKEIFLDIACFFKGESNEYIKKVLDSCDFYTTIGLQVLIERSLISEEGGTLQMHDLIQLMGMDIIKEECHDDPGKRSRLWLHDDVLRVLSGDVETEAIKAIVLKLPKPKETYIGPNAFTNMKKLRLLILRNVDNPFQGPIHLPNDLRWFEWPHCTSIPEFSHGPKKLVGLDLRNSEIEVGPEQFKDFKKLKFINFSECQSLVCVLNLNCTPNLEELDLSGCKNLEHAHKSVACHSKLRLLNLSGCSKLHLPDVLQCKHLQSLILANCSKLQRFPISPNKTKGLRELDLKGTSIEELPASIEDFVSLKTMDLTDCKELSILPSSIYRLQNLEYLDLTKCSKLIKFPKKEKDSSDPGMKTGFPKLRYFGLLHCNLSEVEFLEDPSCFPSLLSLYLGGNNFTNLPSCMHLYNLKSLQLSGCNQLQEILEIPKQLKYLGADGCKSLRKIPSDIGHVDSVDLLSCHELVSNGSAIYDLLKLEHACPRNRFVDVTLPGGEMPKWLVPNKDGHISFMASKDLFKKFLGLVVCVVFRVNEGKGHPLAFISSNNNKWSSCSWNYFCAGSDHVWLQCCEARYQWQGEPFGSNDWSCFQFSIKASAGVIVKKCGFRLICKPLENDLEVFLQHNQLLDPALLYEVWHEESQTGTVEKSSSDTKDLQDSKTCTEEDSSSKLVHKELNMADFSIEKCRYSLIDPHYRNVRPGGEMPEEFVLVEHGTISFMASENLYDKFLELALCAIFDVEDGKQEVSFDIVPYVNGQRRNVLSGTLGSFDSDHTWIQYLRPNVLWGVFEGGIDFGEFEERYLRFSLRLKVSGGTLKKLGYVIRCTQLEDDLKVMLKDNQLVNLASLCEDSRDPVYSEIDLFFRWPHQRREEYLRKYHMHKRI